VGQQHPFGDEPFSVADGLVAGLGRGALSGRGYDRPYQGVRERAKPAGPVDTKRPSTRELLRRECARYAVRMRPGQFFSHETALVLRGAPAPDGWERVVHVSAYRPASGPRAKGVVGHRLQHRKTAQRSAFGLPVEDPVRAWVQTSWLWDPDDPIAAGDHLIARRRRLATVDALRAEAQQMRGHALDDLLGMLREGSESPKETKLRLILLRSGLPEPELNVHLLAPDGRLVARLDLAYPELRVAVEYDGRGHADDSAQFRRDADRWDDIRDQGWDLVRILSHHLEDDGAAAVAKVRAALRRAGHVSETHGSDALDMGL
jgi:hypothetical protein